MRGLRLGLSLTNVAATGGGSVAASTWNPSDKSASVTLTNGNLKAQGAGGGFHGARATNGKTSGKWYFEGTWSFPLNDGIGIANATSNLDAYLGSDANSAGWYGSGGFVGYNGTSATYSTFNNLDVTGVAVDLDAKKLYFRKNATWQNSADPVAGTGGIDITFLTGTVYPAMNDQNTGAVTANFGATAFANAAPSGYTAWG